MSKKREATEITKEGLSNMWKEYYEWLQTIYPMETFELEGRDKEALIFHHGFNSTVINDVNILNYYLVDREFAEYLQKIKDLRLQGEDLSISEKYATKGFISINKDKKFFNFGLEINYQRHGYGRTIYENYLRILEMLGIEDREQYELRVYGNPKHDFLNVMATKALVARTNAEANTENARQILADFSKSHNSMRFSDLNTIIEYAIKSNVPMEEIAKAINDNGFNIIYADYLVPRFEEEDVEKFKSFGITGLKATCMHDLFMKSKTFSFMEILGDVGMDDATLEFRRVLEEVKKDHRERKKEGRNIPPDLEKFGELEYIILCWDCLGLLLKNASPDIKAIVKKQAISVFDEFDPERREPWHYIMDSSSSLTLRMLEEAGLMDKDAYIGLYQKALNRNYNLKEFDIVASQFIDEEERRLALEEISQNTYYPSPKGKWQRSYDRGKDHRIPKVTIPQALIEKGRVRDALKQEILRQGVARSTKIKTTMTGIGKDGKPFTVDNLKDWMFGVPGARGNLQMKGISQITFPPQTPQFAVEVVEQAFRELEHPDFGER